MRRMTMLLGSILLWSSPVFAQSLPFPIPVVLPSLCCQTGTTYGTAGPHPKCTTVPLFGTGLETCKTLGGTLTYGPCNGNGVCGGSAVCCAGVKVGETCSEPIGGGAGVA